MRKLSLSELNRLSTESFKALEKVPVRLLLDNIRSGLNVGSAFRTADAFKVQEMILAGITPQPPHREILKTAIGANQSVDWCYYSDVSDAVAKIKEESNCKIVLVEQTDKSLSLEKWIPDMQDSFLFVFGNEVSGISDKLLPQSDFALEIPQFGTKHSLNISVSIGVILWHYMNHYLNSQIRR